MHNELGPQGSWEGSLMAVTRSLRTSGFRPHAGARRGIVEQNKDDPAGLGRVRVRFPTLPDTPGSYWARVVILWPAKIGVAMILEVDDEVLVAFLQGDINNAIVVGALTGKDKPPYANADGENNLRVFKSRSAIQSP